LEAIDAGVDIIDGSVFGMGRGAGNLYTDAILAYYEERDPSCYRLIPILQFADLHMEQQKDSYSWGYSLPQLLSGVFHCHPNYPTNLLREKRYTADDIYRMLKQLPADQKSRFENAQLEMLKAHHLETLASKIEFSVEPSITSLCESSNAHALLVCGGQSIVDNLPDIKNFILNEKPAVFSVNNPNPPLSSDGVFFGNRRRLLQYFEQVENGSEVILGVDIHNSAPKDFALNHVSRVNPLKGITNPSPFPLGLPTNSAIEAILALIQLGFRRISICGMDGYETEKPSHYYAEHDAVTLPEEFQMQNRSIEIELAALATLRTQFDFTVRSITPTRFKESLAQ
jgi:4-hydroxy 2-oxovalerate aldolase